MDCFPAFWISELRCIFNPIERDAVFFLSPRSGFSDNGTDGLRKLMLYLLFTNIESLHFWGNFCFEQIHILSLWNLTLHGHSYCIYIGAVALNNRNVGSERRFAIAGINLLDIDCKMCSTCFPVWEVSIIEGNMKEWIWQRYNNSVI